MLEPNHRLVKLRLSAILPCNFENQQPRSLRTTTTPSGNASDDGETDGGGGIRSRLDGIARRSLGNSGTINIKSRTSENYRGSSAVGGGSDLTALNIEDSLLLYGIQNSYLRESCVIIRTCEGQDSPIVVYMKWNPELHANIGTNADTERAISIASEDAGSVAKGESQRIGRVAEDTTVDMGGAGQGDQGRGVFDGSSPTGTAGDARNILPRGIEQSLADLGFQ